MNSERAEAAGKTVSWQARLVLAGAAVAICLSAFEVREPIIATGLVRFTISELAVLSFFLTAVVWAFADPGWFFSRRALDLGVLLFVFSNFLSVPVADDMGGAFKFTLRMTFAALVYVGVSRLPGRFRSHLVVAASISVTIVIVTVIGMLENFFPTGQWPRLLSPWQEGTFSFGPFYNVRISSTLPFPTVLSMYLELALPVFLTLGLWFTSRKGLAAAQRFWLTIALIAGLAAMTTVQIFTYTRTALVSMPASMIVGAAAALLYGYGKRVAFYFLLVIAMLGVVMGLSAAFGNKLSSRLGIAEPTRLYSAEYDLLDVPEDMGLKKEYTARVRVTNTSDGAWQRSGDDFVGVSSHWLSYPEGGEENIHYNVTNLPKDIMPGETFESEVAFITPDIPGRYVLVIELFKSHVGWFSAANTPPLVIPLDLSGEHATIFSIPEPAADFGKATPLQTTPERDVLWTAAWRMFKEHPVLGVGAGQFRKVYPQYVEGVAADERLETHNILLEAMANTGLVGLVAMVFLLGSAAWFQLKLVRNRALSGSMRLLALGLLVALAAYLAHGVLDFFLWQNGVTFLFFAELGLTAWMVKKSSS